MRARRPRNFLGGLFGRRADSPRPPARPRAGDGEERSLRRLHPAPSLEEAPLSGAGPAALPLRLGAGRGVAKSAPRAPHRPRAAGGELRRGWEEKRNERETKGAVGFSFVWVNLLTSFAFLT